jgi:photosynthetic reaction center cytochrome c subunit
MYGFRMVRDLNSNFLAPLQSTFPPNRKGPHGDSPKLQCSTCHQGVYKPLMGAPMVKDYPALWGSPSWTRGGSGDTVSVGITDLRTADSIPAEGGPRLAPEAAKPLAAPVPVRR